jgi:hypothetical protein
MSAICLLSGVKWTKSKQDALSAYDPKRTKAGLKSRSAAGSCVLSLVAAQEGSAAPLRFRTIQVYPEDFPASLRQAKRAANPSVSRRLSIGCRRDDAK